MGRVWGAQEPRRTVYDLVPSALFLLTPRAPKALLQHPSRRGRCNALPPNQTNHPLPRTICPPRPRPYPGCSQEPSAPSAHHRRSDHVCRQKQLALASPGHTCSRYRRRIVPSRRLRRRPRNDPNNSLPIQTAIGFDGASADLPRCRCTAWPMIEGLNNVFGRPEYSADQANTEELAFAGSLRCPRRTRAQSRAGAAERKRRLAGRAGPPELGRP